MSPEQEKLSNTKILAKIFSDTLREEAFGERITLSEKKLNELKKIKDLDLDPSIFIEIMVHERNSQLRRSYAKAFTWITCFFTIVSYLVIICNEKYDLKISQPTINALIIETPIQFIGILYIIARNLFPAGASTKKIGQS